MNFSSFKPQFFDQDIDIISDLLRKMLKGESVLTKGPHLKNFEFQFGKYLNSKYGLAVNSGTSALEIVLKAINIKKDDEIILPSQTFVSTGSCIVNNGGLPIFCEIDNNHLLSYDDLRNKITSRTKAVIIVHYLGLISPDIIKIKEYLSERNIYLIEDASHAHGAKFNIKFAGNIGDFGCFSFYSTKIITTGGEGGFITTKNKRHYNKCLSLRGIGIDPQSKSEKYVNFGSNLRMTEFQAIVGIQQLKRIEEFLKHRNLIATTYKENLKPLVMQKLISFQDYPKNIRHSYWRFLIQIKNKRIERKYLKRKLKKVGIKIDWPYQPLVHLQPNFKGKYNIKKGHLKFSESYTKNYFCLPIHYGLNISESIEISKYLISTINEIVRS